MIPGRFYMHEKAMDICFWAQKVSKSTANSLRVNGTWCNLGYTGNPWLLPTGYAYQVLNIDNVKEWHDVTDKMSDVRTESGLPK